MAVLDQLERIVTVTDLHRDGVPCASIAILEDGKVSAATITEGREDIDTIFQACSISKAVTGLAVAKLVDEGRLTYETNVVEHLPKSAAVCIIDPETAHLLEYVTIGHLLSHTAGLSQGGFPGYPGDRPSAEDVLSGRHPSNTPRIHFISFPGAQYSYSGGGFLVLQLFLENMLHAPFPDLMRRLVLDPLGMTRSHFGELAPEETNYSRAHYTASTQAEAGYHTFVELAAAGLWTTPTDLLQVVSAIQQSLHTNSGFLKPETARKMLTRPDQVASPSNSMAMGFASDDAIFAHAGGNDPGYRCWFFGFHGGVVNSPAQPAGHVGGQNGVAVMTGSTDGFGVVQKIVSAVYDLKGWPRFMSLPSNFGKDDYVPYASVEGTLAPNGWQEWVGTWDREWSLIDDAGPKLAFRSFKPMTLRPAAAPTRDFDDEQREFMFVVSNLKIALRLTWQDGERVVELLQEKARTLKMKP